jgi:hypothetical protein
VRGSGIRKQARPPKPTMPAGGPCARPTLQPKRNRAMIADEADAGRAAATTCSYAPNA